jgi:lipopolysaccharide transport system permease protein
MPDTDYSEIELVIEPGRTEKNYWQDLWRYRELFYILSWRDIKVRYKQTVIGAAWSIIRPLLTMIIFTFVFKRVANMPDPKGAPYPLMVYAGVLPWMFFSGALSEASNSLVGNTNLITKIYFPRMIIPASSIIVSLVDFAISFGLTIVLFIWFRFIPPIQILCLPIFVLMAFMAAFGAGLLVTALNVKYRDFRYVIPFIVQFGLYVSPVGFSSTWVRGRISEPLQLVYSLNPMVGIIDGFRWCIVGEPFLWPGFLVSSLVIVILCVIGIRYFRKTEKSFADNI